jgi:hypothetical protein
LINQFSFALSPRHDFPPPFHLPLIEDDGRKDEVEEDLLRKSRPNIEYFGKQKTQYHAGSHSNGALGYVRYQAEQKPKPQVGVLWLCRYVGKGEEMKLIECGFIWCQ